MLNRDVEIEYDIYGGCGLTFVNETGSIVGNETDFELSCESINLVELETRRQTWTDGVDGNIFVFGFAVTCSFVYLSAYVIYSMSNPVLMLTIAAQYKHYGWRSCGKCCSDSGLACLLQTMAY